MYENTTVLYSGKNLRSLVVMAMAYYIVKAISIVYRAIRANSSFKYGSTV